MEGIRNRESSNGFPALVNKSKVAIGELNIAYMFCQRLNIEHVLTIAAAADT